MRQMGADRDRFTRLAPDAVMDDAGSRIHRWSARQRAFVLLAVGGVVAAAIVVAVLLLGRGSDGNRVQVQALWYGIAPGGRTVGGVTPVDITAIDDDPRTPL